VDDKEPTLFDIKSKPYDEFKREVFNTFGTDRVGLRPEV
jgi:hypothetical protein